MENIETESTQDMGKRKRKSMIVVLIASIVLVICLIIYFGNRKFEVKDITEEFIIEYGNLKFPDTIKLEKFSYEHESYEDENFEIWKTTGYFTAENALGMEIKTNYTLYMKYENNLGRYYALWIIIDDETVYGSKSEVLEIASSFMIIYG